MGAPPARGEEGNVHYGRDITERKKMENDGPTWPGTCRRRKAERSA